MEGPVLKYVDRTGSDWYILDFLFIFVPSALGDNYPCHVIPLAVVSMSLKSGTPRSAISAYLLYNSTLYI